VRFDVQGLTGSVTSATLRIYANSASTTGYDVYGVSDNTWTETGITYSNAPAMGSQLGSSGTFSAGAWTSVDVTSYITGNGVYNLAFSTTSNTNISFASREAGANAPQLVIQTASGPTNTPTATLTPTRTPTPIASNTPTGTPAPPFSNATFVYDGDGKRVKSTINGSLITYFVGTHYEVANGVVTKYYYAGAQRIAMRSNGTLFFTLGDHLGSTSLTTSATGTVISELRYSAWGEVRYSSGAVPSKYQYTGQYSDSYINLLDYGSRRYDPELGRFISPDSIVPLASQGVQAYDRYGYVNNNPVNFNDPTGHRACGDDEVIGCNGLFNHPSTTKRGCAQGTCQGQTPPKVKHLFDARGFYLGDNFPKAMIDMQEDIYEGTPVDLFDSLSNQKDALNDSFHQIPNVYATISFDQNEDESINITGISVSNTSDYRVFVTNVVLRSKGSPSYMPNPPRIGPQINSDKFMTIDPNTVASLPLVPSENPLNPNNHFGPSSSQSLTITVVFEFRPAPGIMPLVFHLFP
jgi:RHS repeat-associated protein